jgi:hypothetical protein
MLNINRALENDRLLRTLTGLNRKAFDQLCEIHIHLPHKKPREFSSQRVICEHAHVGIKRYNAVSMIYHNRVPDFDY